MLLEEGVCSTKFQSLGTGHMKIPDFIFNIIFKKAISEGIL